jgi:hypothetical protein
MKPMPVFLEAAADVVGREIDLDAKGGQHVGRAGARRQRTIAVLGNRHTAAGDDEGGAGRDIHGAGAVAAGTDHVDSAGRCVDPQHLGAHHLNRAGDLVHGLAAHAQRHQQAAHLRRRGFARHHAVEGRRGFLTREGGAGRDLGNDCPEIVHRMLSE